ncbi:hypothetical protein BMF94_2121 [Rhodotorula taiwanensis]|uniref:C3H1-type domain-containing protein n=1 Tax=Rhodotorula taiwanensis TaxID=741276 RepID=A0A2S5BDL2_9BASI|nr:hypothetical protein BMF94_2121 [Rhodotorula taiwanensis]
MQATQDEQQVLAEIARLERAITSHKTTGDSMSYPPYRGGRGRGSGYRGRGGGRGRGRGGAPAPSYRNATWVAPGLASAAAPNGDSLIDAPPATSSRAASKSPEPSSSAAATLATPGLAATAARASPVPPPTREVTIDGVVFVAAPRGNKLFRKPQQDDTSVEVSVPEASTSAQTDSPTASGPLTPRRLSHLGTTYIRTKTGNLVSLAFARKRKELADARKAHEDEMDAKRDRLDKLVGVVKNVQGARNATSAGRGRGRGGYGKGATVRRAPRPKSDKLCRFFQRTGQCSRAHTCPYVHDSTKIAVCPLFLRSSCPRTAALCPLSHSPNAHRSPHCVHFPSCSRGVACPYAHVKVSADAVPCRDFVELGWCERGEDCDKRHVRECWRFAETGKCEKAGCREPHVLRRTHTASEEEDDAGEEDDTSAGEQGAMRRDLEEDVDEVIEDAVERTEADHVFGAGAGTEGKKRSRRDSTSDGPMGISGAAGRRLKRVKHKDESAAAAKRRVFAGQDDFVTLALPLSDEEGDAEETGDGVEGSDDDASSVDSGDLEDSESEDEVLQSLLPSQPDLASHSPTAASLVKQQSDTAGVPDEDALDYGDD